MRKTLSITIIFMIILSGCGVDAAATLSPGLSADVTSETTSQTVSSSTPIIQSITGTKDGVDSFLSLYDYQSIYPNDECFNITSYTVKQAGYSVFKYNESCASFLLYEGKVYPMGEWLGGDGIMSMAIFDLNNDGKPELYFTFSWGSGLNRSNAGYFDPATKQITVFDYAYLDNEMLITSSGNGISLYSANLADFSEFTDYTLQSGEYIGEIVYEDDSIKLKIADDVSVSAQRTSVPPK